MDATMIGDVVVAGCIGYGVWMVWPKRNRVSSPTVARVMPVSNGGGSMVNGSSHPPLTHKILDTMTERKRIDTDASIERERMVHSAELKLGIHEMAHKNVVAQVAAASVVQAHSNQLANYVAVELDAKPFVDEFRNRLLLALVTLYDGDGMAKDGRLMVQAPWSKRGKWSRADVIRAGVMFQDAERINGVWAVRMQANGWYVNRAAYDTPGQMVRAYRMVKTPA